MEVSVPESLFDSIKIIVKYQNTLLLKEISKEKGWKFTELKKEFLKEEDIKTLIKKYKKKINKKNKKKSLEIGEVEIGEVEIGEVEIGEVEIGEVEIGEVEIGEVEIGEVEKPKKKKIKKIIKNIEIKCHKYIFEGVIFYVNIENNNSYDKNLEFVGKKLGNIIDFNADESSNVQDSLEKKI